MRRRTIMMSVLVVSLVSGINAFCEEKNSDGKQEVQSQAQTRDPITGDYINEKFYVDYKGKRIFTSSEISLVELKKNPEKYARELESQGIVLENVNDYADGEIHSQTRDPITGDYINSKLFVDYKGKRIYLSDESSLDKVKKDPEKYFKELEAQKVVLENVSDGKKGAPHLQTRDPITGDFINQKFYVDFNGKRIFLSDETSIAVVKKDPEKYIKELESRGVVLESATPPQGQYR